MTIGIDLDQIFGELKRILRELQEFPAASEVAVSEGGVSNVTRDFRQAVSDSAREMSRATDRAIAKLNATHDAIRAAVMQIAEQDAALADETKLVVALLDSAAAQAKPVEPMSADEVETADY